MNIEQINDHMLASYWDKALHEILKSDFETARYDQKLFTIDYWKIDRALPDLAEILLQKPLYAFSQLQKTIHQETNNGGLPINLVFDGSPINQVEVSKYRVKHLNILSSTDGFVVKTGEPRARCIQATFRCMKCGNEIFQDQPKDTETLIEPLECHEELGGCGRTTAWKFISEKSLYKNFQKILIQNPFHQKTRVQIEMHLYDEHTGLLAPGDWATFNGVYLLKNQKSQVPDPYFLVRGIEQSTSKTLEYTEEEAKQAEILSKSPELWNTLITNFAPSVFSNNILKEAYMLQLFGGSWHDLSDGTCRRGSIHILAVGDPGTAKSVLKDASMNISPRSAGASGQGATAAGLTAGAKRDKDWNREGWTLDAGALVMANGGICYLDEFDKIPAEVHGCLHEPMEQGVVTVSKMGAVNQRLPARTSVMASMNPKEGRFFRDDYNSMSLLNQIDIDTALLSRFDLIFAIIDRPNESVDRRISKHMHDALKGSFKTSEYPPDFLRKYIFHAQSINPVITDEIDDKITDYYVELRNKRDVSGNPVHNCTARQKDSLRRLVEASARSRLASEASVEDVDRAIRVVFASLDSLNIKDFDAFNTGFPAQIRTVWHNIEGMLPASFDNLRMAGLEESEIQNLVDRGLMYEKKGRFYRSKKHAG